MAEVQIDDEYLLINKNWEIIYRSKSEFDFIAEDIIKTDDTFINSKGNILAKGFSNHIGGKYFSKESKENKGTIITDGKDEIFFKDLFYPSHVKNDAFLMDYHNNDQSSWKLVKFDKTVLVSGTSYAFHEKNIDLIVSDGTVYDLNGKILFKSDSSYLNPMNRVYLCYGKNFSGLLDKNGKWIIKTNLLDYKD